MPTPHAIDLESRIAFEESLERFEGQPLAVAVCDLDDFAAVNKLGREVGDKVLRAFERTFTGSLPTGAVIARIGGDEYCAALPDHSAESALILLDEISSHFGSHYPTPEVTWRVKVSAGIAARPPHGETPAQLVAAATEALMRSKREGRSRVSIFVEEKMTLKSNYYPRAALDRLAKLSGATGRTEASLLREGLDDLFVKYRDEL